MKRDNREVGFATGSALDKATNWFELRSFLGRKPIKCSNGCQVFRARTSLCVLPHGVAVPIPFSPISTPSSPATDNRDDLQGRVVGHPDDVVRAREFWPSLRILEGELLVPASLSLSEGSIIRLIVHHPAGNPAAPQSSPCPERTRTAGRTGTKRSRRTRSRPPSLGISPLPGPAVEGQIPACGEKAAAGGRMRSGGGGSGQRRRRKNSEVVAQTPKLGRIRVRGAAVSLILGN